MSDATTQRPAALVDLRGRRALVTGGSRGVGRATAELLAAAGADVGIGYHRRSKDADATVAALRARGARSFAEAGDLTDAAAADRLVDRAIDEFGGLDIFVGNAGIWPPDARAVAADERTSSGGARCRSTWTRSSTARARRRASCRTAAASC
jgi:NAD(P)-dependent dehydrogenase (short-subunit alcohol dehydrogenase family)